MRAEELSYERKRRFALASLVSLSDRRRPVGYAQTFRQPPTTMATARERVDFDAHQRPDHALQRSRNRSGSASSRCLRLHRGTGHRVVLLSGS
jgi:hypothetical protein